jgi:hypothetical protein
MIPFKCFETFRDGNVAFTRGGRFYFGPIAKLPTLLSGSGESFLTDDAAEKKVAEIHAQQGENRCRAGRDIADSETDQLAITREQWEHDRRSGRWGKEAQ